MQIPIQNIYYLLCYAWDKLEEKEIIAVNAIQSTSLLDLLARVLISGTEHLIKRGFDRGYVTNKEWTPRLKGRICFQDAIRTNALTTGRTQCEFDELSYDVLHNQILKATIRNLVRAAGIDSQASEGLIRLYRLLTDVTELKLTSRDFGRVQLHRNNRFYDFLMKVCELIHHNLLPEEGGTTSKLKDFVEDERQMARLFEGFVRNFYKKHSDFPSVKREDIYWQWQSSDENSRRLLPKMQTDISLTSAKRKVIIDCKFTPEATRRNFDAEKLRESHLYQIHAYLNNLPQNELSATCQIMLLYPEVEGPLRASFNDKGRAIHIKTINLNQKWEAIHQDLLKFIE